MRCILLTQGKSAMVCDCHYDLVKKYKWQYHPNGYAVSGYYADGKHHSRRMHRIINNTPEGFDTDHINRNKLNNHCSNLRTVNRSANNRNSKLRIDNKSGFKGICWDRGKWKVQFSHDKTTKHIGRFSSIEQAKEALYAYSSSIAI